LRLKLGKANALENNNTQTRSPEATLRLKLGRASALENIFISVSVTGGAIKVSRRTSLRVRKGSSLRPFWSRRPLEDSELVGVNQRERERERETLSSEAFFRLPLMFKKGNLEDHGQNALFCHGRNCGNGCLSVVSNLERGRYRADGSRIRVTDSC